MKKIILLIFLLLFASVSCGCKQQAVNNDAKPVQSNYMVIDDEGNEILFTVKPQRIISLTYGTDEILTELVDSKRIIAYSRWAGDSEISFVTKDQAFQVGKKVNENVESIVSLQPDLVVASSATSKNIITNLKNLGIKVYLARSPHNYQEMRLKILNLAVAVGEQTKGEKIVEKMDIRLQQLENRLKNIKPENYKTVLAFNFTSPMGRKGDLLDDMFRLAHVVNGAALAMPRDNLQHGQVTISKEMVVLIDPDIFLLPTWNYNQKQNVARYADQIMHDPAYQNLQAVKNRQLKFVPDKYRYVASQYIVEAIEKIARTVYPEVF